MRVLRATVCFFAAYAVVTVLAGAVTLIYGAVNHTADADARAGSMVLAPSFTATVPYHVVIMLVVATLFGMLYWRRPAGRRHEALALAVAWTGAAMLVDFVGFVLIENPWSLTPHELYVDYQPWITLLYAAMFVSAYGSRTILPRVWRRSTSSNALATSSSE
ncbi:hypothetical protein [Dactylosporangium sp. CS-033363]|uniref:hypothetical protein n=1 Tax=Dactylosporangium sp. CS-033363 TaxID=3239935 RepID=UPI003D89FBC2